MVILNVANMIHIYTGEGKGKTTAALGLALRALGAGKKVAIIQFLKKPNTSEYKAIKKFKLPILIQSFGIGFYKILGDNQPPEEHKKAAQKGLKKAKQIIEKGDYDLIILDEINVALDYDLITLEEVIEIIGLNKKAELILTGRNAHPKLIKMAELVSVIKKNKHYFDQGLNARKGIEY
ncbi:MAG: cob(I)yrinic acid a,c-diamide adenosyltransferase [Patescibacteria group bacterium]|nr:cob(I)yrinic acid a,c-diamide adenosyltransferase [Patescibacteria group bacterium]